MKMEPRRLVMRMTTSGNVKQMIQPLRRRPQPRQPSMKPLLPHWRRRHQVPPQRAARLHRRQLSTKPPQRLPRQRAPYPRRAAHPCHPRLRLHRRWHRSTTPPLRRHHRCRRFWCPRFPRNASSVMVATFPRAVLLDFLTATTCWRLALHDGL